MALAKFEFDLLTNPLAVFWSDLPVLVGLTPKDSNMLQMSFIGQRSTSNVPLVL